MIGKGGETIKQLQERAGVKMVMIQDTNIPSSMEKPLRISGDPMKCAVSDKIEVYIPKFYRVYIIMGNSLYTHRLFIF